MNGLSFPLPFNRTLAVICYGINDASVFGKKGEAGLPLAAKDLVKQAEIIATRGGIKKIVVLCKSPMCSERISSVDI